MIARLFPAPLLSLALAAIWLLLYSPGAGLGQWLLAAFVGWFMPWVFAPLRPQRPRIRRPWTLTRLIAVVGRDVLVSTLAVGRDVMSLGLGLRQPRSHFVTIPLALRDPSALAALAVITTVVPGTVWCELARDSSAVRLHVWDLPKGGEAAFIEHYKRAYEAPLMEIFES